MHVAECRYKFKNFVDDIHGFFMPVKKDHGLFPDFLNFVDKIHRYFVPVKKDPGWPPTINTYFCDNMEYPLRWAEWMISTKTGLCVAAGLSLYFVYRKNRTEKCVIAGSLVVYTMKDSPLVQDSIGHINHLLTAHSLRDVGTAVCLAAGLTFYFAKRRNRSEKTFVGGCILAFTMRNTSAMQGPIRFVNSLLPLTGLELSAITGLTLYFLYRNNTREKLYIAGCLVLFAFRDTPPIQRVKLLLFSKSGMLAAATAGVAIYLIFFRKKKITPDHIYQPWTFDKYQPYYYDIYYREQSNSYHNGSYYRYDSDEEIIIPPVKVTPFQPTVSYSPQYQGGLNRVNRVRVEETPHDSKQKKEKEDNRTKVEFLEIPPFPVCKTSKQIQNSSKVSRNKETRIRNVPGPSNMDHSNCQCNRTKRKRRKGNQVMVNWPAQSMVFKHNDNQVKTNAECILKQLLLKNTGKASVPSNSEGKQDGLSVASGQNQPNIHKQQINQLNVQKQPNNQPNVQKQQNNQPNIHKQQINQLNVQKQPNNRSNVQKQQNNQPNIQKQQINQLNVQKQPAKCSETAK